MSRKQALFVLSVFLVLMVAGAALWLLRKSASMPKSQAEIIAANRFRSYCTEEFGKPCENFARSTEQRSNGGWLIEYERSIGAKQFMAFFVHDDGQVEISKFKEDAERAKSDVLLPKHD